MSNAPSRWEIHQEKGQREVIVFISLGDHSSCGWSGFWRQALHADNMCVYEQGKEKEIGAACEDAPCVTPLSLSGHCLLVVSVNTSVQRWSKTSTQPQQPTQKPRSGLLTFRLIHPHMIHQEGNTQIFQVGSGVSVQDFIVIHWKRGNQLNLINESKCHFYQTLDKVEFLVKYFKTVLGSSKTSTANHNVHHRFLDSSSFSDFLSACFPSPVCAVCVCPYETPV